MDTFVLIQSEGAYSDRDWKVCGVYSTEDNAILYACKLLVDYALKPWIIDFYKDRNGEFAKCTSLPELHIEHWNVDRAIKVKTIFIGFRERPFKHYIDEYLKQKEIESNGNYVNIIHSWKNDLANNIIPIELEQFIRLEKEN